MKRYRTYFIAALVCFGASALSLAAIPLVSEGTEGTQNFLRIFIACVFWGGFAAGCVCTHFADRSLRRIRRKAYDGQKRQKLPGILTFSGEIWHILLYALVAAGIGISISDILLHWVPEYVMFPVLSVTIFAWELHCFVDGKNYKVYQKMKEGKKNGKDKR